MRPREVAVGPIRIGGGQPLALIGGPCAIESEKHAVMTAERLAAIAAARRVPFIYKSSYDKANRSSGRSYRGPGLPRGTAHSPDGAGRRWAFPCSPTSTRSRRSSPRPRSSTCCRFPPFSAGRRISSLAAARTGKPVNVKKGQFVAPAGHAPRGREDRLDGQSRDPPDRARHVVRLQQPGGGLPRAGRHAGDRLSRGLRRHALRPASGRRGRRARAASASTSRLWPGPPWPSASMPSSWRCTRTPTAPARRPTAVRRAQHAAHRRPRPGSSTRSSPSARRWSRERAADAPADRRAGAAPGGRRHSRASSPSSTRRSTGRSNCCTAARAGDRDGHGQVGHHRAEDRRHPRLHRDTRPLPAPRRGRPRRPGHGGPRRRRRGAFQLRARPTRCWPSCRLSSASACPSCSHGQAAIDARPPERHRPRYQRARGGVPHESRPHHEHHGGPRHGRCRGHGAAGAAGT